MSHSMSAEDSINPVLIKSSISSTSSKQYLVRQHAPTNMYAADQDSQIPSTSRSTLQSGINPSESVQTRRIAHPEYSIIGGEFIHAVLETSIDSNLPGSIRSIVPQPVYAYVDQRVLVPAGSRLIGQYRTATFQGQNRVFIIWNRLVLPSGVMAELNSQSVDAIGRSGQGADQIQTHFFARFGEAALLSILGATTANMNVKDTDQYNSAAQYRMAIAQSFQQSAGDSLQTNQSVHPTLRIFQGAIINVFVAHDIDFYSVLKQRSDD